MLRRSGRAAAVRYGGRRYAIAAAVAVCLALVATGAAAADSCAEICVCKWKGGKQSAECREKSLITLPPGLDGGTQVLDVSGNNLQILSRGAFVQVGLLNLQRVHMSDCRIGQIDGHAFQGLTNVVELDLSRNMLTAVPSATLADVPLLRDLSLARNPIQKLEPDAFRHCAGLVRLDVSGCELHAVAGTAFAGIDRLETLRLDYNRLTGLPAVTVESLNRVHGVQLHGNPWHCDCDLRPVKLWLTKHNVATTVDPVCVGGPAHVTNRTFSSLAADDFACRPNIVQQADDPTVEAAAGDNASVSCRHHSSPAANVSWYWNGRSLANNTAFGPFQRVFMTDDRHRGGGGHVSSLLLTNVQPADSGRFLCVAENRAGRAEANFTLVVSRLGGLAFLANGQVAGLSVFLVFLIVAILLVIVYLLVRIKRLPSSTARSTDGKPHLQHSVVTAAGTAAPNNCGNGTAATAVVVRVKHPVTSAAVFTGGGPTVTAYDEPERHRTQPAAVDGGAGGGSRRPKLAELTFAEDEAGFGGGGALDATRTALYRSQPSNPDLIADAPEQPSSAVSNHHQQQKQQQQQQKQQQPLTKRSASGEYRRTADDSLYSPGFWTQSDAAANDRTPIVEKSSPALPPLPDSAARQSVTRRDPADPARTASLRVWKHGVQVMPPLSALKRALNKGSPDEGYQEGCGTDV